MKDNLEDISVKELKNLLNQKKTKKKRRKKMKFGKRALAAAFTICAILIIFAMVMIYMGKDTTTLTVLATAGVGVLPVMYGIYDHYNTKINLKHMEENYIPDYDEQEGIY